MFEQPSEGFDAIAAINQFRTSDRTAFVAENEKLVVAAFWPDLHSTDGLPLADDPDTTYIGARAIRMGGAGTPPVAEFAVGELAVETGYSVQSMRYFMADAVDIRYRLPRIFDRVRTGYLPRWTAQKVSRETRDLTFDQAAQVEEILLPKLAGVKGKRLDRIIAAALITVDAERYERLADQARRARYFRLGQATDHGIVDIYARMDLPDALRLKAMVERIVTILRDHPDDLPGIKDRDAVTADEWAAVALGVLADPLRAAQLILEHEQPDLFDQAVAAFNPLQHRGWPHPAPRQYADSNPDIPADPDAEPPVDESEAPADPMFPEPPADDDHESAAGDRESETTDKAPEPVEGHPEPTDENAAAVADTVAPRRNHHPDDCNAAVRAIIRAIPPEKLRAPITFNVHCTAEDLAAGNTGAVVRVEEIGPTTLGWARRWFGTDTAINLKAVIDPAKVPPVDAYEIPDKTRDALLLRNPLSRFPYSNSLNPHMDIDHTISYRPGGRWQTGMHDLGPLATPEHRYKTFGPIEVRQPEPDLFLWRTRHGRVLIVNATGTHDLGTGAFARILWNSAALVSTIPVPDLNLIS